MLNTLKRASLVMLSMMTALLLTFAMPASAQEDTSPVVQQEMTQLAGADFWHHLRSCMHDTLGFTSCLADPDIWMRRAKRADGSEIWEYVLLYTDECLVVSNRPESILRNLHMVSKLVLEHCLWGHQWVRQGYLFDRGKILSQGGPHVPHLPAGHIGHLCRWAIFQ